MKDTRNKISLLVYISIRIELSRVAFHIQGEIIDKIVRVSDKRRMDRRVLNEGNGRKSLCSIRYAYEGKGFPLDFHSRLPTSYPIS